MHKQPQSSYNAFLLQNIIMYRSILHLRNRKQNFLRIFLCIISFNLICYHWWHFQCYANFYTNLAIIRKKFRSHQKSFKKGNSGMIYNGFSCVTTGSMYSREYILDSMHCCRTVKPAIQIIRYYSYLIYLDVWKYYWIVVTISRIFLETLSWAWHVE